jgi:hypothetical protein
MTEPNRRSVRSMADGPIAVPASAKAARSTSPDIAGDAEIASPDIAGDAEIA